MTGNGLRRLVPERRRGTAPGARVLALVPHFQCERWLGHCLESLVGQTRPPDGIVVIDDASAEPPEEIVRRFPGVTLLRAAANVGPYRLVQQVIDDVPYDHYLFQDADDWSAPNRLQCLLAGAERTGAELIGSDYLMFCTDEVATLLHTFPVDANAALAEAPTCHAVQHPSSLVSRSLVTRLGGYASGMRFSGDDEFLRRAAHVARVANVPAVLYFRRHRAESLTTSAETGHGSPARREVLKALAARAQANVDAVARGAQPQLGPYAQAPPVELEHVCGPPLDGCEGTGRRPGRPSHRRRPAGERKGGAPLEPVLIVGGRGSGADALLWSLAQHPAAVPVVDLTWLGRLSESLELAGRPSALAHTASSELRHLRPLDPSGAGLDDLRSAVGEAVRRVLLLPPAGPSQATPTPSLEDELRRVAGSPAGAPTCWVAAVEPDPVLVAAVVALLPGARVIHLVRDAEDAALALARQSKSNARVLPLAEAYQHWLTEVRGGLAVERAVGGDQVLRLRFEELTRQPDLAIRRCLDFIGLDVHTGCVRALEQLDVVVEEAPAGVAQPAAARELSTALCGPPELSTALCGPPEASGPALPPAEKPALPDHVAGPAALLKRSVPSGAVVAMVTKGEQRLLDLEGHEVWHFPRTPDGEWAGYHPAGCDDIVRHLGELRGLGAGYFLIPSWARWWLDHYQGLRQHLEQGGGVVAEEPEGGIVFELRSPAPKRTATAAGQSGRHRKRSVSVISWDTAHNPLGRAHILAELLGERYDVELVGAEFEQFGSGVWPPLQGMDVPLRSFPGGPFPEYFARMEAFAETITSDAVVVSKPRLPSYLLGIMAKALRNRPLVLDVDDRELSFVRATQPMAMDELRRRADDSGLLNPYGSHWTRHCEALVDSADHVTVSNETLQSLFGGTIVPHARDERVFDPDHFDRNAVRRRFGFEENERIVLFAGTPRRHKGIVELAGAIREIGDPRARLCLIGTSELESLREDLVPFADLIKVVAYQPFTELPALLAACDLVAVLQDPDSAVSHHQMPAKITDALAMARPCLVRSVAPLQGLIAGGHLQAVGETGLTAALGAILADEGAVAERAIASREVFLESYSFSAVRPRLEAVVEQLLDQPPPLAEDHRRLLAFGRERFGTMPMQPHQAVSSAPPAIPGRGHIGKGRFDIVMFWKQNDTGIYGRRHDMLMQHLVRSERVGQVVQFDAPIDVAHLRRLPADGVPDHCELVRERTMQRVPGIEPVPGLHQHSFLYTGNGGDGLLPGREDYAVHVKDVLARHRIGDRPVVFWVYPKSFDFPDIARAFSPDVTVADVVDDHRSWAQPGTPDYERIEDNYKEIADLSDLVLTNCDAMQTTMEVLGATNVHLVPNAAEHPDPCLMKPLEVPEELRHLEGPTIGYVGNLSGRIDVDLLEHLATSRPHWNIVLVGSAHAGQAVLRLRSLPNVSLLGPRPYEVAKHFVRAFDVGIIPHLDDEMTTAMHPLKAFVYCALGVPVVSTDIANLGELRRFISVATDHDDFVAKVDATLAARARGHDWQGAQEVLRRNCWQVRTEKIVGLIDDALSHRGGTT